MTAVGAVGARQLGASDPAASAWVSASAGTGKTHVLTDRVLRLLLAGTAPERILCLTFTKAAAAEMANRLHARLGGWIGLGETELTAALRELAGRDPDPATLTRARRLFAEVLEAKGGLKVQTIHSFCQSLLGRFPLEAEVAPHFTVTDERTAAERMDAARDRVLARLGRDSDSAAARALATVAGLIDEAAFADLMRSLTVERGRLNRLFAASGGAAGAAAAARRRLGLDEGETRASVLRAATAPGSFDAEGLARARTALQRGGEAESRRAAIITRWLDRPSERAALIEGDYRGIFLTKDLKCRAERNLMTKSVRESDPAAFDALLAEQERVAAVVDRLRAVAVAEATAALLGLGDALVSAYEDEKRGRAELDYDDLVLAARGLLHRPDAAPWVLYKLDGGIDHILVDEAQDTNPEQWDVVAALADEFFAGEGAREERRTVFAVGDAKQSIYGFQRADPDRFVEMEAHFAARVRAVGLDWRPVDLVLSYRSTPAVLDLVDAVFASEAARDGLGAGREVRHFPARKGQAGLVELWPPEIPAETPAPEPWQPPLKQRRERGPSRRLADRIAGLIRGWLREGEVLASQDRPIRAGDIMILVQRRSLFVEEMVRALKNRNVPVAGVDRMVLSEQIAVMDLIALGRFALLPGDDLTLATVLKSPLVGFDDEALFALAYGRGERSLWATLRARRDERPDFAAASDYLSGILGRVDYQSPYDFYATILGALGGRRRLVARLGFEANDPIDEFLGLALAFERSHAPALESFLHWIEAGRAEVKRDLEQGRDEVRVMTVHGAKGLQAPIVFLPDTCRVPRHDAKLLWLEGEGGEGEALLWPPRREFEEAVSSGARAAARLARDREYRRLLYVALTRARDRLYVCGWETTRRRGEGCWYDLVAAAMRKIGEKVTLADGSRVLRHANPQTAPPETGPTAESAPLPARTRLPAWARRPPAPESTLPRPLAPSRPADDEPPVRSPLAPESGARARRGVLAHRLLQLLPEVVPGRRRAVAARFLDARAGNLAAEARDALIDEVLGILDDSSFAPLFAPGSRAEVSLTGVVGGRVISGQVDRLVVTDREVLIVDFKTGREPPVSEDEVAPQYLRQMAAYRAAVAAIYPDRAVRCALLWTGGPVLMPLSDVKLASYAP